MSKPLTFVLNDETKVNSYNFRVKNAKLNLERFMANPVMLAQHLNNVWMVIGRWVNIRFEGSCLLADAEFDVEDPEAKKIAGKVKRGFIKACSLGLLFDRDHMKLAADNIFDLVESEVMEGSIVAIPSNANSVRLFAATGELIPDNEIKLSISEIATQFNKIDKNKSQKMEKIILTAAAVVALAHVGVTSADDVAAISRGIEQLQAKLTTASADLATEKAETQKLKADLEAFKKTQAEALVDGAIVEGRLTADMRDSMIETAVAKYDLAAKLISNMPAKKTLSGTVTLTSADATDPKNMDEFEKLPLAKQLSFKAEKPEAYQALFSK